MQYAGLILLVILWLVWLVPFVIRRQKTPTPEVRARVSRWGIVLQFGAFAVAWLRSPGVDWTTPPWRVALETLCGVAGIALGATAVVALGRQWRFDAALNADHQLIRSGPYAIVRHPIYASLFAMLLVDCFAISGWPQFIAAVILYIAGTEIRVRAEERLLAGRFGPEFDAYRARVPAFIPFLR